MPETKHPLAGHTVEIIKSPLSVLPAAKSYEVIGVAGYMIQLRVAGSCENAGDELLQRIDGRAFWVGLQGLLIIECDQSADEPEVEKVTPIPVKRRRRSA